MGIGLGHRGRVHPDEDLIVPGYRSIDLRDPEHLRWPVAILHDGSHAAPTVARPAPTRPFSCVRAGRHRSDRELRFAFEDRGDQRRLRLELAPLFRREFAAAARPGSRPACRTVAGARPHRQRRRPAGPGSYPPGPTGSARVSPPGQETGVPEAGRPPRRRRSRGVGGPPRRASMGPPCRPPPPRRVRRAHRPPRARRPASRTPPARRVARRRAIARSGLARRLRTRTGSGGPAVGGRRMSSEGWKLASQRCGLV